MGTYILQSNVEDVFGTANVVRWSQLDPDTVTVNATRVAAAISYAEEYVENKFRGSRSAVPFSGAAQQLIDWCAKLAGVWLYESRGSRDGVGDDDQNRFRFHRKV